MADPRLAQAARDDIREIRVYSKAAFGPAVALSYIEGLRAALKQLSATPLIGSVEDGLGDGLRSFPYRSHRVYYRAAGGQVLIARILHQARDAGAILNPLH